MVVATVLPLSWLRLVMPESALTAMRTCSTKVVTAKATSFWRVRVVGGRAALDVDGAVLHQRDAVLRGHRLMLHLERRHVESAFTASTILWQTSMW